MSSARSRVSRPHRFVLVQGGRGDAAETDAEWEDFCRQIGWQGPTPEPDNDLEDRIAGRLFTNGAAENNVVHLDLDRFVHEEKSGTFHSLREEGGASAGGNVEAGAMHTMSAIVSGSAMTMAGAADDADDAAEANFAPVSGFRLREQPLASFRRSVRWGRIAFVAAAAVAAAAAVVVSVNGLGGSNPGAPSALVVAVSAEVAVQVPVAPRLDEAMEQALEQAPADSAEPSRVGPPRRSPRAETTTVRPIPKATVSPSVLPKPPGALASRRAVEGDSQADAEVDAKGRAKVEGRAESIVESRAEAEAATQNRTFASYYRGDSRGAFGGHSPLDRRDASLSRHPGVGALLGADLGGPGATAAATGADSSAPWRAARGFRPSLPTADSFAMVTAPSGVTVTGAMNAPNMATPSGAVNAPSVAGASGAVNAPSVGGDASSNWSLSPTNGRWIGASVTPPPPSGSAQANMGVMVQVDLGTAFNRL